MTFLVNEAKWEAAKGICNCNEWDFKLLTEKTLFR